MDKYLTPRKPAASVIGACIKQERLSSVCCPSSRLMINLLLPEAGWISYVYCSFGALHPTYAAEPAVLGICNFGYILLLIPGYNVHRAKVIALTTADAFCIIYFCSHATSPPSGTRASGQALPLSPLPPVHSLNAG